MSPVDFKSDPTLSSEQYRRVRDAFYALQYDLRYSCANPPESTVTPIRYGLVDRCRYAAGLFGPDDYTFEIVCSIESSSWSALDAILERSANVKGVKLVTPLTSVGARPGCSAVAFTCGVPTGPAHGVDYDTLDPGIRETVRWLRSLDFETTDSGDGVSKFKADPVAEALAFPHVFMTVRPPNLLKEAARLWECVQIRGVTPQPGMILASYDPADGSGVLALTGVGDKDFGFAPHVPRP